MLLVHEYETRRPCYVLERSGRSIKQFSKTPLGSYVQLQLNYQQIISLKLKHYNRYIMQCAFNFATYTKIAKAQERDKKKTRIVLRYTVYTARW